MTYDDVFADYERSDTLRRLFGEGMPPGLEPFSFVPLAGLRELAGLLFAGGENQTPFSVRQKALLVDLGCGRGGPGIYVARAAGARLIGVDSSRIAIEQATVRGEDGARFVVGSFESTGLEDEIADGIVCVDAFRFATSHGRAAAEMRRILRRGSRIVLTGWDRPGESPVRQVFDEVAGLEVVAVHDRSEWEARRRHIYQEALRLDVEGDAGLARLRREASAQLPMMSATRRVIVVVEKHPA